MSTPDKLGKTPTFKSRIPKPRSYSLSHVGGDRLQDRKFYSGDIVRFRRASQTFSIVQKPSTTNPPDTASTDKPLTATKVRRSSQMFKVKTITPTTSSRSSRSSASEDAMVPTEHKTPGDDDGFASLLSRTRRNSIPQKPKQRLRTQSMSVPGSAPGLACSMQHCQCKAFIADRWSNLKCRTCCHFKTVHTGTNAAAASILPTYSENSEVPKGAEGEAKHGYPCTVEDCTCSCFQPDRWRKFKCVVCQHAINRHLNA